MPTDHRLPLAGPGPRRAVTAFASLALGPVVVAVAAAAAAGWMQRLTATELAAAAVLQQRLDRNQAASERPFEMPLRWLTALERWLPDGVSLRRAEHRQSLLELEGDAATVDALEALRQRLLQTPWIAAVETAEVRTANVDAPVHRFVLQVRFDAVAAPE